MLSASMPGRLTLSRLSATAAKIRRILGKRCALMQPNTRQIRLSISGAGRGRSEIGFAVGGPGESPPAQGGPIVAPRLLTARGAGRDSRMRFRCRAPLGSLPEGSCNDAQQAFVGVPLDQSGVCSADERNVGEDAGGSASPWTKPTPDAARVSADRDGTIPRNNSS